MLLFVKLLTAAVTLQSSHFNEYLKTLQSFFSVSNVFLLTKKKNKSVFLTFGIILLLF